MKHFNFLTFLIILSICTGAHAHLMPEGKGTLNLIDNAAYVVISVPMNIFTDVNENKSSSLNPSELKQRKKSIREQVEKKLTLSSPNNTFQWQEVLLSLPSADENHDHTHENIKHVAGGQLQVMAMGKFNHKPDQVNFQLAFSDSASETENENIKIKATISEGSRTMKTEMGLISPQSSSFTFFSSPTIKTTAFIKNGIQKILSKWSYILFIFALLSAIFFWKRRD